MDENGTLAPLGVWGHLDSLSVDEVRAYARRVEQLGYGALWVPETVGREPFALLGIIAASTDALTLGTSIVSIWGRDPQATRMAAMTLHEATGARFVLGLGVSHLHLAQKVRGHVYERPLERMRDYVERYRAAHYKGPVPAAGGEPPILVAALRRRMLELSAAEADGAFPYLVTADRVRWMRSVLDDAIGARPKPLLAVTLPVALARAEEAEAAARAYLASYLRTPNYQASWAEQGFGPDDWEKPGSDRLVREMVACGDEALVRGRISELHVAGADHVALIPLARDGTTEELRTLEVLAPAG